MISQANIKWISTLSGVSEEEISGALSKDEEVTLDFKLNGRVITQEEESQLKDTLKEAGIEIGYKKIAKESGIELYAGEKDPKIIADKIKESINDDLEEKYKGQTPSDELLAAQKKADDSKEAYDKLLETHQETLDKISEKDQAFLELKKEIKTKETNNLILNSFPEKMQMDRKDALLITTNAFEFVEEDGVMIAKREGKVVTDGLGKPEKIDLIVKSFVEEKKWIKGAGAGGGDREKESFNKGLTPEQAEEAITKKGIDPGSTEGLKMFNEMTK